MQCRVDVLSAECAWGPLMGVLNRTAASLFPHAKTFLRKKRERIADMRRMFGVCVVVVLILMCAHQLSAQGVGTAACREVQRITQLTVGDENPAVYRNHGDYVSAAAAVVSAALSEGRIDAECSSCIMNQFARRIPVAEQTVCGPPTRTKTIVGPDPNLDCSGDPVGTLTVLDVGPFGLEVGVNFTNAAPNLSFDVFWTCTTIANGCHDSACGFVDIGDVSTNALGAGSSLISLPAGNPFPGMYVHWDICKQPSCAAPVYTAKCGTVYPSLPSLPVTSALALPSAGDPAKK